ncbi:MAG: phage terminase large subunit [Betaproteobacteria bacterium]|nr:phage terminase large subunit [Betaproteobacteria bacterium]
MLTPEFVEELKKKLPTLPEAAQQQVGKLLAEYSSSVAFAESPNKFMSFVKHVWPNFIHGRHHAKMAAAFERVANGEIKRLIINMPPRHTKSEFASYLLPAWFLGKFPQKKIIQTSHTAELAVGFGRKVRNLVDSDVYKSVFPQVALQADSKAAGRWATNKNGEYFAIGVGGAVTGKGADLLIIDDPHSEQEATLAETNPEVYDKTYEWYTSGPRQRLQPGGAIVIVMCMTGDTPVLMADGTEKPLSDIIVGDVVATFDKGRLSTANVINHQSNGVDTIYQIQTQSGKIVYANERHPFLVMNNGVLEWTRLKHLQVGDLLVALKDVLGPQEPRQNPDYVNPVCPEKPTTKKTLKPHTEKLGFTANGKVKAVLQMAAQILYRLKGYALNAIEINIPHQKGQLNSYERPALKAVMVLQWRNMTHFLRNKAEYVLSAGNHLLKQILALIGTVNYVSITAITPEKYVDYFAMIATLQSDMEIHQKYLNELQRISDFTLDPIVSIVYAGEEEVFDIQIERTENFIANGLVSHNTRWSKKDLTGQVLKSAFAREGDEWEVIDFPAIMPSGQPLWPEFWSLQELEKLREELPVSKWMAQYMQQPTSDVSAIIKREWWQIWEHENPPYCEYLIQSWDTAFLKTQRSDYSACTTWGVFYQPDDTGVMQANIILLNAFKERMEFPELKRKAYSEYMYWNPDCLIIEAKASGAPLMFELRAMGIPVEDYTPTKGNDKIMRLNSVSDIFASGRVWVPETRWAEELVEEVASFPSGEHDDLVDSMSQALIRFRKGGFIQLATDWQDPPTDFRYRKKGYY